MGSEVSVAYFSYFVNMPEKMILCYDEFMSRLSFTEKVYQIVAKIPAGQVLSYQQVAKLAGSPRACRAVGNIMHNNPDPKNVPCHRVVAANNHLGGFAGGPQAKIKKLQAEGWKIQNDRLSK